MKILLVLYGIARGPLRSYHSISTSIIQPIRNLGFELEIVYILKDTSTADYNIGSRGPPEHGLCKAADVVRIYREDQLLDEALLQESRNFRDKHDDGYVSNARLICQLRKLQISTEIVDYALFDRVILCRDDLEFNKRDINWPELIATSSYLPITTTLFWNNGMSERFFVGTSDTMKIFASRILYSVQSLKHSGCLNGEYLQLHVAKAKNIKVAAKYIRFSRIRSEDTIHGERLYPAIWRIPETLRVTMAYFRYLYYRRLATR